MDLGNNKLNMLSTVQQKISPDTKNRQHFSLQAVQLSLKVTGIAAIQ